MREVARGAGCGWGEGAGKAVDWPRGSGGVRPCSARSLRPVCGRGPWGREGWQPRPRVTGQDEGLALCLLLPACSALQAAVPEASPSVVPCCTLKSTWGVSGVPPLPFPQPRFLRAPGRQPAGPALGENALEGTLTLVLVSGPEGGGIAHGKGLRRGRLRRSLAAEPPLLAPCSPSGQLSPGVVLGTLPAVSPGPGWGCWRPCLPTRPWAPCVPSTEGAW